jgi:hypothetical protein
MKEGAWLPSPRRGYVWADSAVQEAVEGEIQQMKRDLLERLQALTIMTEVGECVMLRSVLAELSAPSS